MESDQIFGTTNSRIVRRGLCKYKNSKIPKLVSLLDIFSEIDCHDFGVYNNLKLKILTYFGIWTEIKNLHKNKN